MRNCMLVIMAVWLLTGCNQPRPVVLDEEKAIQSANLFLQAIMRGNYAAAYNGYMSPGLKYNPQTSGVQFTADWKAIIDKYGIMQKAVFTGYQRVPGKQVIQLYYQVKHSRAAADITYHLVSEWENKGGFKFFLVDIGNAQVYSPNRNTQEPLLKKPEAIEITP